MAKKVVLITGASGNIGKASLQALGAYADSLDVKAGVRNAAKPEAAGLSSLAANVSLAVADPLSADFVSSLQGVDYLYIVTPGAINRMEIAMAAIEGAKAAGLKFVLLISVLTATRGDMLFGRQFGPLEEALRDSGLQYAILRLPFFLENNYGYASTIKEQGTFYGPVIPEKPLTAVAVKDVGEVAAKILSNPEPHFGKTYKLSSPLHTYAQLATAYSEVLGKPITYTQVPYEAARSALLGFGFQDWQIQGIEELNKSIDAGDSIYVDPEAPKSVEEILGRPPISMEEWVKQAASAFQ